ncbi:MULTISPECIES: MBL fold metallo-hydrolase [Trueperella]|uniref:MBL fold metallo-hydrolase n=1 Tax=Trueperella bernardiae TaxID=59561 RepID=A0A0W1KI65_9ACTO|nr:MULTISPECIES: MBL fold metallo-hydrolase [Trueperella]KTF03761.1 putative metallo-hydrolase [Trueperella bernardiae]MCM3907421.1 MBL fold metallo-hydrolase [Trueperella bernardiae]MDK8601599.1 MBL fold metallo-hydrolase [Trueperella bernardiae]MDV6238679.1 MBL fold metallo-hydrolase [Trueperella bernardiae]PKZ89641.1 MBL fold metallo-hydrolase [Trueperella bernardiae]
MYSIDVRVVGSWKANCYLLQSDSGVVMIDPGAEPEVLLRALGERKLEAILLTHCHSDHIGAVNELVAATGAPVYIGVHDAVGAADPRLSGFADEGSDYAVEEVTAEWDDETIFSWSGGRLHVIATPGHTPGSICLLDADNEVLYTGDTLFSNGIGSTQYARANRRDLLTSLKKLGTLPDDIRVLPGHGQPTTMGTEKLRNPYLV